MPLLKVTRKQFDDFVASVGRTCAVYGPVVKERFANKTFHVFDRIDDPAEMVISYTWTVFSPKKLLNPQHETLFNYRTADFAPSAPLDASPRIIFGVHNCDMNAVGLIDWVFLQDTPDSYYAARRRNTLFAGVNCLPDGDCFCQSIDWHEVKDGYDLYLHAAGDRMMLEARSPRGRDLLDRHARGERASEKEAAELLDEEHRTFCSLQTLRMNTAAANLPVLFTSAWESPVWAETAERCVSCGACHLVCPTCFCSHTADAPNERLNGGSVTRTWDGCMLRPFTAVATGENFRYSTLARLKHRWYRKHKYLFERVGKSFCVGCGRCGRECPVDIKPVEIVNALLDRL